ncbi:MAG: chemotaxis protein CheW [Cyanobacteria bacterium J06623_7]
MVINEEYFTIELASQITLGFSLNDMSTVAQFETQTVCSVPGVPDFWYGVVNFKGSLLWILDSDRFFNLDKKHQKQPAKLTVVVVKNKLSSGNKQVAVTVGQLKGIASINPASFSPPSPEISSQLRQSCSTAARVDEQTINIIDSEALLQRLSQESTLISA